MSARVGAVLLAAGGSRRLGRAKQLLELDGRPLVARAVDRLAASRASPIVAVLGADADAVAAALPADLARVVNPRWRDGQSTSVRAGLDTLAAGTAIDGAIFVPCDQPRLTTATIDRLIGAFVDVIGSAEADALEGIAVPVYGAERRRGAPVLFGRGHFDRLRALTGDTGGRVLLAEHADRVIEVPIADGREAEDVDTAEDWRQIAES